MTDREIEKAQRVSATDAEMRIWRKVDALRESLQRALLTLNVLVLDPQPGDREMAADTIRELCPVARLDPDTLEENDA